MRIRTTLLFVAALVIAFNACDNKKVEDKDKDKDKETPTEKDEFTSLGFTDENVTPADFPKLDIPGFNFPEDSTTLNGWITSNDTKKIHEHAWGIWTGLTSPSNQNAGDQPLLVYETWLSPSEMIDSIKGLPVRRSNRINLRFPNQFEHARAKGDTVNSVIFETVAYSPAAATHAISNKLFMATTLHGYAQAGLKGIPDFPNSAITIKPVYKILPASSMKDQSLFAISTWHGTIAKLDSFSEPEWKTIVYIDLKNQGKGDGKQMKYTDPHKLPEATPDVTYNLNDFIHFRLNKEDVHYFQQELTENAGNQFTAGVGDIAVLVGMHVTTKENKRWTWQTFWWAPDANTPPAPSSKAIADARPAQLKGAPRHYAMAVAYYMVDPKEPYAAESVAGHPNYAFNPYLEAGFGPATFNPDQKLSFIKTPKGDTIPTYVGVRTNCMSCHSMATVNPTLLNNPNGNSSTQYVGNSYVSLYAPQYQGQLTLDFAWSIQGNVDTTGYTAYLKSLKK